MHLLKVNTTLILLLLSTFALASSTKSSNEPLDEMDSLNVDTAKRLEMHQECKNNKKYLDVGYYIHCENNYHHYNSTARRKYDRQNALRKKSIRIAEFNALHPGMSKTRYKDYRKVAQMLNQYDVIGVTELIPLMAADYTNNQKVVEFLEQTPLELKSIKEEIKELKSLQKKKHSIVRERELILLDLKQAQLKKDLKEAEDLYREPGYLKILHELHKLPNGKDWALLLSPRGEGAVTSHTPELVGYYYRASIVKPKSNKYCKSVRRIGRATPYACIVNMDKADLGEDKTHVFSRRPFLAEFISGRFSFVLLTSHVIFDSPKNEELKEKMFASSLGTDALNDVGNRTGLTGNNWARFAEIKVTLEFIQKYSDKNSRKDVIFMGDFNLEDNNAYWPKVLSAWNNSRLFITDKTSTNEARFLIDGTATNGVTSNYDHFILNPEKTKECVNEAGQIDGGAFDFQKGRFGGYLNRMYRVRESGDGPTYNIDQEKYEEILKRYVSPYEDGEKAFKTIGSKTVSYIDAGGRLRKKSSSGVVIDAKETKFHHENFVIRMMDSQLKDKSYYTFYKQLISDHLPVYIKCSNR